MKPNNIHYAKDALPIFQFEIDPELIDAALTGVIELKLSGDTFTKQKSEIIVANRNVDGSDIHSKVTFVSNTKSNNNSYIKAMANNIEKLCKNISNEYYGINLDFRVKNCTALMFERSDAITRHTHFPYTFVAATYLHVKEGASPIFLGSDTRIYPKSGMCLIFPGHLSHEVEETLEDRIIVTMDVQVYDIDHVVI